MASALIFYGCFPLPLINFDDNIECDVLKTYLSSSSRGLHVTLLFAPYNLYGTESYMRSSAAGRYIYRIYMKSAIIVNTKIRNTEYTSNPIRDPPLQCVYKSIKGICVLYVRIQKRQFMEFISNTLSFIWCAYGNIETHSSVTIWKWMCGFIMKTGFSSAVRFFQ